MLLSVVCMLYDTVCILSVYGVQVVRFSVCMLSSILCVSCEVDNMHTAQSNMCFAIVPVCTLYYDNMHTEADNMHTAQRNMCSVIYIMHTELDNWCTAF